MNKYIKKTEKYSPVCLNTGEYKDISLDDLRTVWYDSINEQFNFDNLFDLYTLTRRRYNRAFTFIMGKGLIINIDAFSSIWAVVVTEGDKVLDFTNDSYKEEVLILVDKTFIGRNVQEFKRLKTEMNNFGMSSRKQIRIVEDLNSQFTFDPLQPSLTDYNPEVQKELSSEFIRNCQEIVDNTVIETPIEVKAVEEVVEIPTEGTIEDFFDPFDDRPF